MKRVCEFFKILIKNKFLIIFTLIFSFTVGYFLTSTINYFESSYECVFYLDEKVDSTLLSKDKLQNIKDSADKYSEIDVDALIKGKGIYYVDNGDSQSIISYSRYYEQFFLKSSKSVSTRAKMFIKDLLVKEYGDKVSFKDPVNIIEEKNTINGYIIGAIASGVSLFIEILVLVLSRKNLIINDEEFYDNKIAYSSPFHLNYWKEALSFVSSPKKMTILAMLFALQLLSKLIHLPSGFGNLGLSFVYIFFATISMIFGPVCGVIIGALSDILGFFVFDTNTGTFFFGYTFQAMLTGFIYGLMLYKKRISFPRILSMRLIISLICNIIIGSICWGIVASYNFEETFAYAMMFVLPKNIIYLIPQSIVLYIIIKALGPTFNRFGIIDKKICDNIRIL